MPVGAVTQSAPPAGRHTSSAAHLLAGARLVRGHVSQWARLALTEPWDERADWTGERSGPAHRLLSGGLRWREEEQARGGEQRVGSARSESACGGGAAVMELLRKWLGHPEDIYHLLRFKMGGYRVVMPRMDPVSGGEGGGSGGCHLAGRGRLL